MSHTKEKHAPAVRDCENNNLQRQDRLQVPSKSTENQCAGIQDETARGDIQRQDLLQVPSNSTDNPLTGMQAADAETARSDIQRPRGMGRPRGSSASVSSVSSKVIMKK